ncbi:hypothetical protein [Streptomyces sp. NPDC102476]|uniref:hypothetical protein n=1 Tax=Streptomyces sp. NPDC102476 TaxID=3366181 RepID=UPI00381C09FD
MAFVVPMPMPMPGPLLGPPVGIGRGTGRPVPDEIVDGGLRWAWAGRGRCGRTSRPGGAYGVAGACIRETERWLLRAEGSRELIAEDQPERHASASREFTAGW